MQKWDEQYCMGLFGIRTNKSDLILIIAWANGTKDTDTVTEYDYFYSTKLNKLKKSDSS